MIGSHGEPWLKLEFNKCCLSVVAREDIDEVLGSRMTKEIRGMVQRPALVPGSVPAPHSAGAVATNTKLVPKQRRPENPTEFRRANG
jgi:hypothetical protein